MTINITRRAALAGALASSAALAVPAIPAIARPANWRDNAIDKPANLPVSPVDNAASLRDLPDRIAQKMRELGDLLQEYQHGEFRAVIEPGPGRGWLQSMRRPFEAEARVAAAEGKGMITIRGVPTLFDSLDIPGPSVVTHADQGAGSWTEHVYRPERGARYVYIQSTGEIGVGPLRQYTTDWRRHERRLAALPSRAVGRGMRMSEVVKVLGKVLR